MESSNRQTLRNLHTRAELRQLAAELSRRETYKSKGRTCSAIVLCQTLTHALRVADNLPGSLQACQSRSGAFCCTRSSTRAEQRRISMKRA